MYLVLLCWGTLPFQISVQHVLGFLLFRNTCPLAWSVKIQTCRDGTSVSYFQWENAYGSKDLIYLLEPAVWTDLRLLEWVNILDFSMCISCPTLPGALQFFGDQQAILFPMFTYWFDERRVFDSIAIAVVISFKTTFIVE